MMECNSGDISHTFPPITGQQTVLREIAKFVMGVINEAHSVAIIHVAVLFIGLRNHA